MASYTGLATGAGAADGLETLLTRMRAEEEMAQRRAMGEASMRHQESADRIASGNASRLDRSSDISNEREQLKLGVLKQISGLLRGDPEGVGAHSGAVPVSDDSEEGDLSNRDTSAASGPSPVSAGSPRAVSGFSRVSDLDTPGGRAQLDMAGLHPNEMFGPVRAPKAEPKPEDLSAEETFYSGRAKKAGYSDYKTWGRDHPDQLASARRTWAEQQQSMAAQTEPLVQLDDPDNPGQTIYAPRSQAVGKHGPRPAAQKEKSQAYNSTLDLIDEIESLGDKVKWQGIGPIEGRVGRIGMEYFGAGDPDQEQLRNKIDQLKTAASFQEGGKQFTGTEKALLDAFLAGVNQDPLAARTRLKSFKEQATRSLESMGVKRAPHGSAAPAGGGVGDMYDEYLKRHKTGGGGQ